MTSTLFTVALAALLAAGEPPRTTPREPNPFAPSLPLLTEQEEEKLDTIIQRFIKYDIGELPSDEAKAARKDFDKLGPAAIPALIRGLNDAAKIDHSCPAVVIAKKLARMLAVTEDQELLQFARENIGAGITHSRHMVVLRDLRVVCITRKSYLARQPIAAPAVAGARPLRSLTVTQLAEAAGSERGARLKEVLVELERRRGDDAIAALGTAASSYEKDVQLLARDLLVSNLSRETAAVVKERLKDDRAEVRAAAARAVGSKFPALAGDVIDLLKDDAAPVRDAAHRTLVRLNRDIDLGPGPKASDSERTDAMDNWRAWWMKQGSR